MTKGTRRGRQRVEFVGEEEGTEVGRNEGAVVDSRVREKPTHRPDGSPRGETEKRVSLMERRRENERMKRQTRQKVVDRTRGRASKVMGRRGRTRPGGRWSIL